MMEYKRQEYRYCPKCDAWELQPHSHEPVRGTSLDDLLVHHMPDSGFRLEIEDRNNHRRVKVVGRSGSRAAVNLTSLIRPGVKRPGKRILVESVQEGLALAIRYIETGLPPEERKQIWTANVKITRR
jgi:hypothetical protein